MKRVQCTVPGCERQFWSIIKDLPQKCHKHRDKVARRAPKFKRIKHKKEVVAPKPEKKRKKRGH